MDIFKRRNGAFSYDDGVDALIDRTIERASTQATTIRANAFRGCTQLKSVDAPNATSIGNDVFSGCTSLTSVVLSNVTNLGSRTFDGCTSLDTVNFPSATIFGEYCFRGTAITELTTQQVPNLVSIGSYGLRGATALRRIFLPNASVGLYGCAQLTALTTAVFNGSSYYSNFEGCSNLSAVDMSTNRVNRAMFSGCSNLSVLVHRATSQQALENISAFTSTPFADGGSGGTLYVPQALISAYQAAANWSTILGYENNQILPIEGSVYETQYADGTPIE